MIDSVESPYIVAASADNFKLLVLENSTQGPVLVNFWSKKAGPCLRLYPLLDKLVHEYDGRVLLVNVDADTEVTITRDYGITSVPTLKLFRKGQVVETRHGFQSESDLETMLQYYVSRESDQVIAGAIELYANGERDRAFELIADTIVQDPVNPRLPLTMCKLLKHERRYDEAVKLIEALPEEVRRYDEIDQLFVLLSFLREAGDQDVAQLKQQLWGDPDNPDLKRQLAVQQVVAGQYENALSTLAELAEQHVGYADNYALKAMAKLFRLLDSDDPLIAKYRPYLKQYLH